MMLVPNPDGIVTTTGVARESSRVSSSN